MGVSEDSFCFFFASTAVSAFRSMLCLLEADMCSVGSIISSVAASPLEPGFSVEGWTTLDSPALGFCSKSIAPGFMIQVRLTKSFLPPLARAILEEEVRGDDSLCGSGEEKSCVGMLLLSMEASMEALRFSAKNEVSFSDFS